MNNYLMMRKVFVFASDKINKTLLNKAYEKDCIL